MINFEESKLYRIFLKTWRPFFYLAVTVFLVYSATLFADIVYLDDNFLVTDQYQFNKNLANIPQAFCEDIFQTPLDQGTFYRPIMRLSLMFDAQFGEEQLIFVSHFNNLCLHILAVCLFFVFLLKLNIKKGTAFILSLIGAVHPLTAQVVAFIPGRNDSLLAIFVFLSFIMFLDFSQTKKLKYFIWHLVFFLFALFTKETAIVLPVMCFIYLLFFVGWKKIISDLSTYLILGFYWIGSVAVWFVFRRLVLNNFIGNAEYNIILSVYKNLPSLIPAIGKVFLPFDLSVFPILRDMSLVYGFVALLGLLIYFFISTKKDWKFIAFGFSWFLVFVFLTLVKPVNTVAEFSENRLYLPLFGFCFVILGLGRIKLPEAISKRINYEARQSKIIFIISLLLVLIFSSVTIYRNKYYQDGVSFWTNAVVTSPNFAFGHNNLGAMYYLENNFLRAERSYRRALVANETEPMVHNNLGLIYFEQGKYGQAEKEYKKELSLYPTYDKALFNLGNLYYEQKRFEEALQLWQAALRVNPNYYEAYSRLLNLSNRLR